MGGADRGVSDTLGFVFIFALVISTVGLTFTFGYNGLQDTRDFERLNNAERAFDVMGDNFDDIVRRGAPSRATEVKVADAQLALANTTTVNVTVTNATGVTQNVRYDIRPVVYEAGNGRIVYSNGAVFREDRGGAVVVRHSEFVLRQERVLLPVVNTRGSGETRSTGGTTTVLVRAQSPNGQRQSFGFDIARTEPQTELMVNVTSPRPAAWARELGRYDDADCDVYGETVSCTVSNPDRVYVQETLIGIEFE